MVVYNCLIFGLLDITDNLQGQKVVPPKDVVRRDPSRRRGQRDCVRRLVADGVRRAKDRFADWVGALPGRAHRYGQCWPTSRRAPAPDLAMLTVANQRIRGCYASGLAKQIGLGRKPASTPAPEPDVQKVPVGRETPTPDAAGYHCGCSCGEPTAKDIRRAVEDGGELASVVELRRHFP